MFNVLLCSCRPFSLCVLVNPLLNCTLCNVAKKFGLIKDQSVCDRVCRPANFAGCIVNICPEKQMVPVGVFMPTLLCTTTFPISF